MAKKAAGKEEEGQEGHGVAPTDEKEFAHGEKQEKLIGIWKKHPDWTVKQIGEAFAKQTGATVSAPTVSKAKAKALGNGNGSSEAASTAAVTRRPGRPPAGRTALEEQDEEQVSLVAVQKVRQLVEQYGYGVVREILLLFAPK